MLVSSELSDRNFIARAKVFSIAAGIFIMLVGFTVLAGWSLNIDRLRSIYGPLTMKANPAVLFVLAGLCLCLLNAAPEHRIARTAARACAILIGVVGLLTLSEHLFGLNLGIDQLLFTEPGE